MNAYTSLQKGLQNLLPEPFPDIPVDQTGFVHSQRKEIRIRKDFLTVELFNRVTTPLSELRQNMLRHLPLVTAYVFHLLPVVIKRCVGSRKKQIYRAVPYRAIGRNARSKGIGRDSCKGKENGLPDMRITGLNIFLMIPVQTKNIIIPQRNLQGIMKMHGMIYDHMKKRCIKIIEIIPIIQHNIRQAGIDIKNTVKMFSGQRTKLFFLTCNIF